MHCQKRPHGQTLLIKIVKLLLLSVLSILCGTPHGYRTGSAGNIVKRRIPNGKLTQVFLTNGENFIRVIVLLALKLCVSCLTKSKIRL